MSYSKIEITFLSQIYEYNYINFSITDLDTAVVTSVNEVCKDPRLAPYQFNLAIGSINNMMGHYLNAFNLDYNSTNLYDVDIDGSVLTITAKKDNIEFSNYLSGSYTSSVITNAATINVFDIDSVDFSTDSGRECSHVSVDVTCVSEVTTVVSPTSITGNTGNTVSFDYARGSTFTLEVNNGITTKTQYVTTPISLAEPTVVVVVTPSGATATISGDNTFTLQYSLDGITYQSTSNFPGLTDGTYVAYIRDEYGCVKTTYFDVNEFTPNITVTEPVAYISNTNALRFKKDEVWDSYDIFKTDQNTLSCEENVDLPNLYVQKYMTLDEIPTQVKTNYENISITTHDISGVQTSISSTKKTENVDLKNKRDCLVHDFGDNTFGFYFINGNTYDYDTGVVDGTYELFGGLPVWGKTNQYVFIEDTNYYKITGVQFVESINAQVLLIAEDITGISSTITISTIYNAFNWEAYEFDIDMSNYDNNTFYVKIVLTDDDFDTVTFKSEAISVASSLVGKYKSISYSNSENNDILFSTGIEFLLRLTYDTFGLASESEIEIHKTDNYVYKLDGSTYPKKQLILTRLSTMMARKVTQLFVLDNIIIDGVTYTVESIDEPKRIGVTNLYNVTIKLYESKGQIEAEATTSESSIALDDVEIPDLIDSGDGFIEK